MMKFIRRLSAGLLAGVLTFTLTACGGGNTDDSDSTDTGSSGGQFANEKVMTVNGNEVEAGTYAASYLFIRARFENMMQMYGVTDPWEGEMGDTYNEQVDEATVTQVASLYLIPEQFKAAGLTLTDDELSALTTITDDFRQNGFTEELYDKYAEHYAMLEKLENYYFGENGTMAPEESEIESYYQEHYMRAKHVLISTMDERNQEITDEATLKQLEAKAQDIYQRAISGEDFDALIEEYGEDPGYDSYPDGYVFTEGEMTAEFEDGVKALEINSISEPVKSSYGWHIIQRLPLREEDRADLFITIVESLTGMSIDSLLDQWVGEAEITREPMLDEITFDNITDYMYDVE